MAVVRNRGKNARNVSQKIWLSEAEIEKIKAAAGEIPVATWLRDLALGQESKPPVSLTRRRAKASTPAYAPALQPLSLALAKLGNNLNQIARSVNSTLKSKQPLDAIIIANQLARIRQEVHDELRAVSQRFLREVNPDAGKNL